MRTTLSFCLFLLLVPAHAQQVQIDMSLAVDGLLLVTYTPPEGVTELQLADHGRAAQDVWKQWIQPLDECALVVEQRIRLQPSCKQARFAVKPQVLDRDAAYEPALPVGARGVAFYTRYYALSGVTQRWHWHAPDQGAVLHQGLLSRGEVSEATDAAQIVYLGEAPSLDLPGGVIVADPALGADRTRQLRALLAADIEALGKAYGVMPAGRVGVIAAVSALPGRKLETSTGRMMSLRLPATADPRDASNLAMVLLHETTHWWNAGVFHSEESFPWIHEGHAEWMALLLGRQLGVLDARQAVERLEWAVNSCVALRGDKPAASLPLGLRGRDPYQCGMALMMAAQLERSAREHAGTPVEQLVSLHRGHESSVLTQADVAVWADGRSDGPLARLLFDPKLGFATALQGLLGDDQVEVTNTPPGDEMPAPDRMGYGAVLMSALMVQDCGGNDFYSRPDGFKVAGMVKLNCGHLRVGQIVETIEGVPMTARPNAALVALRNACKAGRSVRVGIQGGTQEALECPVAMPEFQNKREWHLKPAALARLGLR